MKNEKKHTKIPILRISEHLCRNLSRWGDRQTNFKTMFYLLSFNTLIYFRYIQHEIILLVLPYSIFYYFKYPHQYRVSAVSLNYSHALLIARKNVFFRENMKNAVFEWRILFDNYSCQRADVLFQE
jgi:hypothetical protein